MSDRIKSKVTVQEESSEEMLREKLETIRSKEQLDERIESLWEYVRPVMRDLIALNIEETRKKDNINAMVKEAECKEKYMDGMLDKAISIEAEAATLFTRAERCRNTMAVLLGKAQQREKENNCVSMLVNKFKIKKHEQNAAIFAVTKKKDELSALRTETATMKDTVIAMASKLRRDVRERKKLSAQIECTRDIVNALLAMIEGKQVEVSALHQEPSEEDSVKASSGNLTAGSDSVSEEDSTKASSGNLAAGSDCVSEEGSAKASSGNLTAESDCVSEEGSAKASSGNLTAGSDCVSEEGSAKASSGNLAAGSDCVSEEGSAKASSGNLTAGSDCVSEEDSTKASSGNLAAGSDCVFHKASRLFGTSKTDQLFYTS